MPKTPRKILLIDDHDKVRSLYRANLEAYTGAVVCDAATLDDGIALFDQEEHDIVITRGSVENRDAAKKMWELIQNTNDKIDLMVIGNTSLKHFQAHLFKEPIAIKTLIQACANILQVTPLQMFEKDVGEFYPIPLSMIMPGLQLVCPVYKKVEDEYNLLLDKDQHLHQEVIVLLKNVGIDEVYVEAKNRLKFINSLTVQITDFLRIDRTTIKEKVENTSRGFEMVREMARKMMMDEETIHLAQASIETMSSIVSQVPTLKQILELAQNNTMSFAYQHSLLTTFVACHIIKHMDWGTRDQQAKIAFVSFFHDISLVEDRLCEIHSEYELKDANFSEEDYDKVNNHALRSAKFVAKYYTSIPLGADIIIKQHHGSRDGIGFKGISQNISPLAIVFLVAEEWAIWSLRNNATGSPKERETVMNIVKNKFSNLGFTKVIQALEKLDF